MADSSWTALTKRAAMEAFYASKPCDYYIGVVSNENPLEIKFSQSLIVDVDFLDVPRNLSDYVTEIIIDGKPHSCGIKNSLKTGEKVLAVRKAGGQGFALIDRVVG
ncbi:MAG: DUF2577 domain-containing protein [Lachnospiraceae bacterium]|nr:DUF2577 domain-containing protein [Lachnospiraceae bacterium]